MIVHKRAGGLRELRAELLVVGDRKIGRVVVAHEGEDERLVVCQINGKVGACPQQNGSVAIKRHTPLCHVAQDRRSFFWANVETTVR